MYVLTMRIVVLVVASFASVGSMSGSDTTATTEAVGIFEVESTSSIERGGGGVTQSASTRVVAARPMILAGRPMAAIPAAVPESVTFTVAGDMGARGAGTATLGLIADLAPDAHFVTGDLSYNDLRPETAWCSYVQNIVGTTLPFQLISGNHEDDGAGALIRNFTACLPDRLNVVGDYGVQYYADIAPFVRIIGIVPQLTIDGVFYAYAPGTAERLWLETVAAEARGQGKWVVVLHHKVCINAAEKPCSIGEELASWEAANADLVVMSHSHTYERSHQLTCVDDRTFNQACVADSDGDHAKGDGAVFVINGVGGRDRPVDRSDVEAGYFAALMGNGDPDAGNGVVQFTVSKTALTGTFIGGNTTYSDTFTITAPTPPPGDTALPVVVVDVPVNNAVSGVPLVVSGSVTDDTGVTEVLVSVLDRDTSMWWNGSGWQTASVSVVPDSVGAVSSLWSYVFDPGVLSSQAYWMRVRPVDVVGKLGTAVTGNFSLRTGS